MLVPTFRYAAYLDQAVESVLAQDFQDFELIISDDASDDGSAAIIAAWTARDPRVRGYVQPNNLGMVAHWNWCLRQAKGSYVKFLFGDDYLADSSALGRLVRALDDNPTAVLATGPREWVDQSGRAISRPATLPTQGLQPGPAAMAACFRADRNLIGEPSAVLFRRSAGMRGFDPTFRQLVDLEMWYHLLAAGDLVNLPATVLAFRVHARQQTAVNSQSRITSVETLRLVSRYHGYFRPAFSGDSIFGDYQRRLARVIYYARKERPRQPEAEAAEADLLAKLGQRAFRWNLRLHRLAKPLENLRRKLRRAG